MTVASKEPLTKKQQRAFDLLSSGKSPAQAAKRMGITTNGVYGHLRRIREKGHEVTFRGRDVNGSKSSRRSTTTRSAASSPNGSSPNGKPSFESIQEVHKTIDSAVVLATDRLRQIEGRRKEIAAEQEKLASEDRDLKAEAEELAVEKDQLAAI